MREQEQRGFSLVEMLVVMVIMSILAAVAVPAFSAARESARSSCCKNNLRQLGIGLMATASRQGVYCTGAFDWKRDGCITEVGWVADLAAEGIFAGDMLCPSNPAQVSETLNDLLTATTFSCNVNSAGQQAGLNPDNTPIVNPCRKILGTYPGGAFLSPNTEQRRKVVEDDVLKLGYNTNYAASWFMVRGAPLLDATGNVYAPVGCTASLKERSSTTGPLREMDCDRIGARTTVIPLLGCAAESASMLVQDVGKTPSGSSTAISFTAGPVMKTTMAMPTSSGGSSWTVWNKQTLQDYRAFAPIHGRTCNVLFVDGGVRSLTDTNRDGFLNNGFPASTTFGFTDNIVEVGVDQIRSQWNVTSQ